MSSIGSFADWMYSLAQCMVEHNLLSTDSGSVSMGQGQEVHARRLLQQCQQQVTNYIATSP